MNILAVNWAAGAATLAICAAMIATPYAMEAIGKGFRRISRILG